MRCCIAIPLMILLWLAAVFPLYVRNLCHWACQWLDRWFDLLGFWSGTDFVWMLPRAADEFVDRLPPGFGWLPRAKKFSFSEIEKEPHAH